MYSRYICARSVYVYWQGEDERHDWSMPMHAPLSLCYTTSRIILLSFQLISVYTNTSFFFSCLFVCFVVFINGNFVDNYER